MTVTILFVTFAVLMLVGDGSMESASAAYRHRLEALHSHLLSNYSGHFAPFSSGHGSPESFPVDVKFTLVSLLDLNAAQQILSTLAYLIVEWTDADLQWDPLVTDSPGTEIGSIQFSGNEIWTPSLMLLNRADDNREQRCPDKIPTLEETNPQFDGSAVFSKLDAKAGYWIVPYDADSQLITTFRTPFGRYCWQRLPFGLRIIDHYDSVTTHHSGQCTTHMPIKLDTTCGMDVTHYPFDIQKCKILLGPLYGSSLNLTASHLNVSLLKSLDSSGEWNVSNVDVFYRNIVVGKNTEGLEVYRYVEFQVTLERMYLFYMLTLLAPIVILSITGACGFLLPLQCGEKVSFQVAIMVSLAVFLSFIYEAMPKTSTSMSRLALYVDFLLGHSCLSFLATLTVLRGHYHHERLHQEDKELLQEQREAERIKLFLPKQPEDQTIARESSSHLPKPDRVSPWQAVVSRWRRAVSCVRKFVRRWYCCCCCIPPQYLDPFFFLVFFLTAIGSLVILVI